MRFSILINAHPQDSASLAAYQFGLALCESNNDIHRLFFVSHGVLNAAQETPLAKQWRELIERYELDACCCVNSCMQHQLASENGQPKEQFSSAFTIAGLGQLVEASVHSDRVITFGARHDR